MIVTARGTFNPHCEVWTVILSAGISATKQGREFPPTMEIDSIINVAENRAEFREQTSTETLIVSYGEESWSINTSETKNDSPRTNWQAP